jgi:hypothetical protein
VGTRWNFATKNPHSEHEHLSFVAQFATKNPHSEQHEHLSFVARIANDFKQINDLFNDTINAFCCQIYAYTTSNESFTYSQMLREADHTKFFEAMEIEIDDHETCHHWDLILHADLPPGAKTIMVIWSYKGTRFPDGTLNKHKA